MSNFLSKIREKIASKERNTFDLSCQNITTNDFFKIKPVYTREMVPGSSIHINMSTFTRLTPLVKPMYGSAKIVNRAFFVPYRTIMEQWNEFITDTSIAGVNKPNQVPTISNSQLVNVLTGSDFSHDSTAGAYDFSTGTGSSTRYYQFNSVGRRVYDILLNLGYSINFNGADTTVMSALPLLAYHKVYTDWYRNPQYTATTKVKYEGIAISSENLKYILLAFNIGQYDKDYFTSAWDNPSAPGNGLYSAVSIEDPTSVDTASVNVSSSDNGTPYIAMTDADTGFTQYLDSALHRLTDYMKRHQLAGTRAMERFQARFGIQLADAKLDRSVYLGSDTVNIEIADVMNTTGSEASDALALGDYAGKGIGYGKGGFTCNTDEYGQLIVISVLQPKIQYTEGRDRQVNHVTRLSFYTPEFDGLGVQAIRQDELKADIKSAVEWTDYYNTHGYRPNGIFGYTSRYAEYKVAQDRLTGDFRQNSRNTGLETYHLTRYIDSSHLKHNNAFCVGEPTQYDRIFANDSNEYDHFITIYHFDVKAQLPMSKMFDDYEWSEDSGREQSIELGGVQMN